MHRVIPFFIAMMLLNSLEAASQAGLGQKQDSVKKTLSLRVLPQNFYTRTLSYTCMKEFQLQKLTRLPVFIRLGSKEYVDYLEGKALVYPSGRFERPDGWAGLNFTSQPLLLRLNKN